LLDRIDARQVRAVFVHAANIDELDAVGLYVNADLDDAGRRLVERDRVALDVLLIAGIHIEAQRLLSAEGDERVDRDGAAVLMPRVVPVGPDVVRRPDGAELLLHRPAFR